MAVVALLCGIGAFVIALFLATHGLWDYYEFTRSANRVEAIATTWLHGWLHANFGPAGVLVFFGFLAILFVAGAIYAIKEWWGMRAGKYDPARDSAKPGVLMNTAVSVIIVFAVSLAAVRVFVAWSW